MTEHFMEDYFALNIMCTQRSQHNSQRKVLTQTGQGCWMGFHSSFFSALPPSCCQGWKWKGFSDRGRLRHRVTQYL